MGGVGGGGGERNSSVGSAWARDYLNGLIKKRSRTQKSHPKVVNPRDIAGERKKKKKKKKKTQKKKKKKKNWSLLLLLSA